MRDDASSNDKLAQEDVLILLADYEQASEEARYRDRLLFSLYYFVILILGGLGSIGFTFYSAGNYIYLSFMSFAGFYAFSLLSVWAYGIQRSRNAAWKHSDQIEAQLRKSDFSELNINRAIVNADTYFLSTTVLFDVKEKGSASIISQNSGSSLTWKDAYLNASGGVQSQFNSLKFLIERILFQVRGESPTSLILGVLIPLTLVCLLVFIVAAIKTGSLVWIAFLAIVAFSVCSLWFLYVAGEKMVKVDTDGDL